MRVKLRHGHGCDCQQFDKSILYVTEIGLTELSCIS